MDVETTNPVHHLSLEVRLFVGVQSYDRHLYIYSTLQNVTGCRVSVCRTSNNEITRRQRYEHNSKRDNKPRCLSILHSLDYQIQAGMIFTELFHFNLMIINQCRNFWKRVWDYFRNFLAKSVEGRSFKLTTIHFYLFNAIHLLDNSSGFFCAQSCFLKVNFVKLQLQKRKKVNIRHGIAMCYSFWNVCWSDVSPQ